MVATVRCEEIAKMKFSSFVENEVLFLLYRLLGSTLMYFINFLAYNMKAWSHLEEIVQSQHVPGFGKKLTSILDACLSE